MQKFITTRKFIITRKLLFQIEVFGASRPGQLGVIEEITIVSLKFCVICVYVVVVVIIACDLQWFISTHEFGTLDLLLNLGQAKPRKQPREECEGVYNGPALDRVCSQSITGMGLGWTLHFSTVNTKAAQECGT